MEIQDFDIVKVLNRNPNSMDSR